MSELWQKTGTGRYAADFQNHRIEVIRNPDWPQDPRRYQPVVNGHPIDTPKHNLRAAQTVACQHVTRSIAGSPSGTSSRSGNGQVSEPDAIEADFAEVEPAQPAALPPPQQLVTFTISGTVTTADHIAAMTEIRAAFDMLRSVADVKCRIVPPDWIDL